MKAKEYAERHRQEGLTNESLIRICRDIFCEFKTIADKRNITTDDSAYSIFKELNQKWKAFAGMFDHVNRDGFVLYIKTIAPELYELIELQELRTQERIRREKG